MQSVQTQAKYLKYICEKTIKMQSVQTQAKYLKYICEKTIKKAPETNLALKKQAVPT